MRYDDTGGVAAIWVVGGFVLLVVLGAVVVCFIMTLVRTLMWKAIWALVFFSVAAVDTAFAFAFTYPYYSSSGRY